MNKKLLFAAMSLAALTACTNDDFESKQQIAQESSPITFEILNNDDAFTRASINGNGVKWSAATGDLFTLYHGATLGNTFGHQNATYTTGKAEDGKTAVLSTPSMIRPGGAVMVWPADTTFHYDAVGALTIQIPEVQGDAKDANVIANQIPYVSDEINIDVYDPTGTGTDIGYRNTAGKGREYPVFMRPMASQINLIAEYAGTDAMLATLCTGDDPIDPIRLTSVDLLTKTGGGTTDFTQEINVAFTPAVAADHTRWNAAVADNAWNSITGFGGVVKAVDKLTTKHLNGNESCKFLILPQGLIADALATDGVDDAAIVVNTIYGKVVVAPNGVHGSEYKATEIADAWSRYISNPTTARPQETAATAKTTSDDPIKNNKYKTTSTPAIGLAQTINAFSANTAASGVVQGEPQGAVSTRYLKVLLTHLDMSDLHVTSDDQLRYAAKVWQKMGLSSVTVYLDGDANNEFEISQKTIKTINDINAKAGAKFFHVMPCNVPGEVCDRIVITGASEIKNIQNLAFITNATKTADVVLKAGEEWTWNGTVKVATAATTGIASIINEGTMVNGADATLNTFDTTTPTALAVNIPFVNDGTWNVNAGIIRVQNAVTNNKTLNIAKDAQYRQDGANFGAAALFINDAQTLENRFLPGKTGEDIGLVVNKGVFAAVGGGAINNYSLIKHEDKDAKTYITHNEEVGNFASTFAPSVPGPANKMGRINLPFDNKDEDNISISAVTNPALMEGFVSVTITADNAPSSSLSFSAVGEFVNYLIVNGGINEIANLPTQIKYVEVDTDKELAWNLNPAISTIANYDGLIILSDVNIKLGTTVNANVTYLGAEMYVGGTFNKLATDWDGYYGVTSTRVAEHYITFN